MSVVVATYNRQDRLRRLIETLDAERPDEDVEVVVVNDASTDDTAMVLDELVAGRPGFRAIHLADNGGPARARNVGWRQSRGDVVLFTDDDCVIQPGWFEAMLDALAAGADLVEGRIEPDPDTHATIGPFGRTIEPVIELNPFFATCNMAYRRAWLEKLGGFDETFAFPWCEDTDLGQRAVDAGAALAFRDDAVVVHDVFAQGWWAHVLSRRRKVSDAQLVDKHPHMRAFLGGIDAHTPALAALVGILIALFGRTRLTRYFAGPLLVLVYVRKHAQRHVPKGLDRRVWWLAGVGRWLADVYEAVRYARARLKSPARTRG